MLQRSKPLTSIIKQVLLLVIAIGFAIVFIAIVDPEILNNTFLIVGIGLCVFFALRLCLKVFPMRFLRKFRLWLRYIIEEKTRVVVNTVSIVFVLSIIINVILWFTLLFQQRNTPLYILLTIVEYITSATTYIGLIGLIWLALSGRLRESSGDTLGSAHFATLDDLKNVGLVTGTQRDLIQEAALELGHHYHKKVGLTEEQQERHVLIIAPTGGGKTSGVIIPGLLREDGRRSLVINDVKGDLLEQCAGALAQSYHIRIFSPTIPERSHYYNPLAAIKTVEDAEDFADCWVENTGLSQQEPFWNRAAVDLITAVTLHLCDGATVAPPLSKLADILRQSTLEELKDILANSPSMLARETMKTFMNALSLNPKLGGSIMLEVSSRFRLLNDPGIRRVTSEQEFRFQALVEQPTAFFLSIPAEDSRRLKPLSACFLMQLMKQLTRRAQRSPHRRLPMPVAFYLDEFVNAGRIPHFEEYISLVRSAGIAFLLAIQDFGRLSFVYGGDLADTIRANCNTHIVFPGIGLPEARYYSEHIGETTVMSQSTGQSFAGGGIGFSVNDSEAKRRLMNPDEIIGMPDRCLLILYRNTPPFWVIYRPYYKRPDLLAQVKQPFLGYPVRVALQPPKIAGAQQQTTGTLQQRQPPPPDPYIMP